MFLPIEMQSVNHAGELLPGDYVASRRTYASRDWATTMFQFEYRMRDAVLVAACDIVFIESSGVVRACDFLRMPDRSWRDSFGARSDSLLTLLPRDVAEFELVGEDRLGELHVREAE